MLPRLGFERRVALDSRSRQLVRTREPFDAPRITIVVSGGDNAYALFRTQLQQAQAHLSALGSGCPILAIEPMRQRLQGFATQGMRQQCIRKVLVTHRPQESLDRECADRGAASIGGCRERSAV